MANGNDLKLRVLFNMVDGVTAPLRGIMGGSKNLAKALKGTREELSKLQKVQKDVTAFREMRTGLSSTSNSLTTARERVKGLARSLRDYGPPSQQMTANLNAAREAARRLTSQQKKQATELQQVRQRLAGAGIDTRNLAEHQRTLAAQIAGSNRALAMQEEKLNRVTRASRKMQANRKAFDNAKQFAGSTAAVGATSGALGGGILMSLKSVLTPAVQYNAAMSKVQALGQLDKNSEDFKALRQQSRDLGASTSFTDTQIAQGQGFLAMAGFRPQKIIKSMPGMLNMAKAGGIGLDRAADISSNILTGFGLDPDDMDRVSDVMTMTFTTSNTNLEMLGETMKYVGPVARAAGMDLEQASATAGLLGNAGIQASQAGTTLRSMLLRLASPTSKATKALKELKVSSLDAKGNVRDIPSILRDVAVATEKMGSGKRLGYLKRIFGEEPAAGMAELISQQGVRGIEKYVEIVRNSGGAAQRIGQIMSDNLAGDLQLTQSALEDLGITMSDSVDSPLRKVTQWVNKAILAVSKWAQRNPELTATLTKIALVLGAVLTVAGMLTLTLAAVVVPLAAVKMSLGVLGIKGGSAIGVVWKLSKALLGLGRAFLFMHGRLLSRTFRLLTETMSAARRGIGRLARLSLKLPLLFKTAGRAAQWLGRGLWSSVRVAGQALLWLGRIALANPVLVFAAIIAGVAIYIWRHWDTLGPKFAAAWKAIKSGLGAAADWMVAKWSATVRWVKSLFSGVGDWFGSVGATFTDIGSKLIDSLVNGITNGLGAVKDAIGSVADGTVGWFKEKLGIHSPSEVFSELGGFIGQGAAIGIEGERSRIASATLGLATVAATAFGIPALAHGTLLSQGPTAPLVGSSVPIDSRPSLAAAPPTQYGGGTGAPMAITINIYPSPGADPTAIATAVRLELDRRERAEKSRIGSRLSD